MAPPLKLWTGLALGGLVVLSITFIPPSNSPVRSSSEPLPEEELAMSLQEEVVRTSALIRRMRWMDSLPALAAATAHDRLAVGGDPRLVTPEQLDTIRDLLRDELSTVRRGDDDVLVGYFVHVPGFAGEVNRFVDGRNRLEVFAGWVEGSPYCLVLDVRGAPFSLSTLGVWRDANGIRHSDLLQTCRFVVAHGLPGPEVRAWLARGGARYAERSSTGEALSTSSLQRSRDPFGRRLLPVGRHGLTVDRCVAGEAQACAEVLLERGSPEPVPFDGAAAARTFPLSLGATLAPPRSPALTDAARYLVSDLEREYGARAFRRFWTSEQDVADAFQAAFGEPIGAWAVRWVGTHVGLEPTGPALPHGAWVTTIVLLLGGALAGGAWQRRRAVA